MKEMNWNNEAKSLLDEFMEPVPVFVRPMARKGIEAKIKELASGEEITTEDVIRGYILASPGKMKERAKSLLERKNIDLTPYQDIL